MCEIYKWKDYSFTLVAKRAAWGLEILKIMFHNLRIASGWCMNLVKETQKWSVRGYLHHKRPAFFLFQCTTWAQITKFERNFTIRRVHKDWTSVIKQFYKSLKLIKYVPDLLESRMTSDHLPSIQYPELSGQNGRLTGRPGNTLTLWLRLTMPVSRNCRPWYMWASLYLIWTTIHLGFPMTQ